MARPLRIEYPGAYYHVINRGNNQEKIFKKQPGQSIQTQQVLYLLRKD